LQSLGDIFQPKPGREESQEEARLLPEQEKRDVINKLLYGSAGQRNMSVLYCK